MTVHQGVDIADVTRIDTPGIELMDLASPLKPSPSQYPFQLTDLPPEIRLEILAYAVISPSTISWQGCYNGDKAPHPEAARAYVCNGTNAYLPARYNIAAPLLASRALYAQTAPVFYGKNTFRFRNPFPGLPLAFNSPTFTTNLRHLTIGTPTLGLSERQSKRSDRTNSARVDEITRLCPALRKFTNHIPQVFDRVIPVQRSPRGFLRPRRSIWVFSGVMIAVAVGLFIVAIWIFAR